MQNPDFADLAMFVRVADAGGFRAAASRYGVSASSLSDSVQRLEQVTGVRLFNRTTRSVVPTDAGQRLLDRLRPALAEVASAYDGLTSSGEPAGTLRLDVPGIVARYILPPIVAAFLATYPRVRLEVSVTDSLIDVMAAGCVAGIRYEEHLAADMMTVPIGPSRQRYVAVASPAYLEKYGTPRHPRELTRHACIAHMFAGGRIANLEFEREGEKFRIQPQGRLATSSSDIQVAAAISGAGVLLTFHEFVSRHIEQGELITVLDDWPQEFNGPFLYFPRAHRRDPPLAAFVNFIRTTRL